MHRSCAEMCCTYGRDTESEPNMAKNNNGHFQKILSNREINKCTGIRLSDIWRNRPHISKPQDNVNFQYLKYPGLTSSFCAIPLQRTELVLPVDKPQYNYECFTGVGIQGGYLLWVGTWNNGLKHGGITEGQTYFEPKRRRKNGLTSPSMSQSPG